MKKTIALSLLATTLLIGGCKPSPKKKTTSSSTESVTSKENPSSQPTSMISSGIAPTSAATSTSSTPTSSSTSSVTPTSEIIEGVFIRMSSIEAKVGVTTKTPLVDVYYTEGHSSEEFDNPLIWDTSDHSIATSDQRGRVTATNKGIVTLTCTSVVDNKSASVKVYCYNTESDFEKSWKRMEPSDTLIPGDQLIIACPQEGKAATDDCSGMKLHSCDVTFNTDKSVMTNPGDAAQFVLGVDYKGRDGYNLEVPEREDGTYLACTNEKKVSFFDTPKATSNLWEIEYNNDQSCWDMRSATTIDGWMMYNKNLAQFAPYQSSETEFMKVITLYRLTRTFK